MKKHKYQCPKCGNTDYETDEIRTTGGMISKVLDVQNKKYSVVICKRCKYSEFYKTDSSKLGDLIDFFTGK